MIPQSFNDNWHFFKSINDARAAAMGGPQPPAITLPHDAMSHEPRTPDTPNGAQTGFYPGGQYVYQKTLYAPADWQGCSVILEFEGVYQTAQIYLNGTLVAHQLYGYSNFYADLTNALHIGEDNQIRVIADNSAVPNSRWYSGSGMYRGVRLWVGGPVRLPAEGVRVTTLSADEDYALVEIAATVRSADQAPRRVEVCAALGGVTGRVPVTVFPGSEETVRQTLAIPSPALWDCDHPYLYDCTVTVKDGARMLDHAALRVGLRTLTLDPHRGLRLNGRPVKLRGACIHHDNGILGAATWPDAERRRCRQLKEAGFNALRSAHHPMSREMLEACDELGVLVMDEVSDMWTQHKNPHDFALHFPDQWPEIIDRMVAKDYNHPSVVLYSIGNEITEVGSAQGCQLARAMTERLHRLDPTRYTTNGINGLVAAFFGGQIYSMMQELMPSARKSGADDSGSNAVNGAMGLMAGETGDRFAVHPTLTALLNEPSNAVDVIGLNYLTGRHLLEQELHPNKTVVGTETFPADIARLWGLVKRHPHILGDFTWAGYDYLGEAGCGIFHYDGAANFSSVYPERTASIGDLDLLGDRHPISYLREIVYGLRKAPYIAVERVDRYGQTPSRTPWMLKDNLASWTWPGFEGQPANVDVYSDADEVELLINGRSVGRRPAGEENRFTASFTLCYEPGELTAVAYADGQETGRHTLHTAGAVAALEPEVERGAELTFVTLRLTDAQGRPNLFDTRTVTAEVESGELLGFGSACPCSTEPYDGTVCPTWNGAVMAVFRGHARVRFTAGGLPPLCLEI